MMSFNSESSNTSNDLMMNAEPEPETSTNIDEYVVLDLQNLGDLQELDKTFNKIETALAEQKMKLAAKWSITKDELDDNNSSLVSLNRMTRLRIEHKLLIDLQTIIERISRIGMLEGKKYSELENEQNKAISKLTSIVELEEEARVSSAKAMELAKETELEMKMIDQKREIIAQQLKKAEPELIAARQAVTDIDDRALNELISLKKPPTTVTNVLTVAVWIVNSSNSKDNNSNKKKTKDKNKDNNNNNSSRHKKRAQSQSMQIRDIIALNENDSNPSSAHNSNPGSNSSSRRVSLMQSELNPINETVCKIDKRPQSARSQSRSRSRNSKKYNFDTDSNNNNNNNSRRSSHSNGQSNGKRNSQSNKKRHSCKMDKIDKLKSRNVDKILTQSWSDTRVMLTRGNFKKRVLEFEPKMLPKHVSERIEKDFLILEDFTIERANQASKVLGPLVKWILSIIGYTSIWYSLAPMAKQVSELEQTLEIKKLQLIKVRGKAEEAQMKVIEIRTQMLAMVGYHRIGDLYFLS